MPGSLLSPIDPQEAIRFLSKADRRLARLIEKAPAFELNMNAAVTPYESLQRAIVYQSISGKAAATIFSRIRALSAKGGCPAPEEILQMRSQTLRRAGLSAAKAAALKDLASKTVAGVVPTLEEARKLSDQELVARLISIRGVGAWTVEMFLIFRLGRPDVLPIHDYGVQKGFAITYRRQSMPKPSELAAFGDRWRPFRTVASWYMWRAVELAGKSARTVAKKKPRTATKKVARKKSG